jgi:phosphoribosylformylglycinamidine (FGAM) synthase-like amidotransferase family enzyme
MPHPENAIDPLQGAVGGRGFFKSLAAWPALAGRR